ncbi:hypothetical protein DTO013E5_2397 [Penicillium roqueforti]|nr:uncharacterized protein LCP9604111_2489 [Penicillium roqueforti]KAF9251088.1 hypothetical protein LCP9604111_2489 [Penicillium roqueforti]KAI1838054.1 hypothetical protein CBS147337_1277 [Penicillium roqueforti]KAI2692677.1 hypothetical protein LCP963914a_771 [Penicillium roqueforti]KAI2718713.1 hypothetical protein CBS147318_3823 [Penicillium roqueforti]KAI2741569.1 hypothetical protein DTO013F2_8779 [Penicillium roqueforti]
MVTPTTSSDTLFTPPSPVHLAQSISKPTTMATEMDLLSTAESPPPVVPKLIREASDITWQESLESKKTQVVLVRRRGRFRLLHQQQFKNSLLASVGYLELANAGDFAANVWNQTPVPKFAAVLMGIGGTLALGMVLVAIHDFRLSWINVKLLRAERAHLQRLRKYHCKNAELARLIDSRLGVGVREIGTEVIDRIVMDVLMGFGSLLVGVGTLMAIGGANPHVFKASNLLSGYIGNGLAAVFGLFNAIWSGYLFHRFHVYNAAVFAREPSDDIRRRLHTRFRGFQWHAIVNGLNGLVAGAASMVTAERWWGYVVLIPCIISLILCNYFWRKQLGYDRPLFGHTSPTELPLIEDLQYVIVMQRALADLEHSLPQAIIHPGSLDSILHFIVRENMLEKYCESLARDKTTHHLLASFPSLNTSPDQITVSLDTLFRLPPIHLELILEHAKRFLQTTGVRVFTYRERHLLELLGHAISQDHKKVITTTQDDRIEHA